MYDLNLYLFGLFGLLIGSFTNVLIYRIPRGENIALPPSHCIKCGNKLKWWHNIPVISYIFLKGKCAFCKEKISLRYPLVEIIVSLIFVTSYIKTQDLSQAIILSSVFTLLLALAVIDIDYKAVPDSLNLTALSLSIFANDSFLQSFQNALLFAGGFTLLRFYVSFFLKKEALGEADIMIGATIGALLGIKLGFFSIFLAALLALPVFIIVNKKNYQVAFVPFLSFSLWIVYMFDERFLKLLDWLYE